MPDGQKVEQLLIRAVSPDIVWPEVQRNIGLFEKPTFFEGGCEIKAITNASLGAKGFAAAWAGQFARALREIRNGLSHSKESRMEVGIPPTHNNLQKLQNWVTLISISATEAMIFRSEA